MRFDFTAFFEAHGVPHRTSGKNVKKGWVNVCCPFCGDDNGYHLGCNPDSGGWACWRNKAHRSRDPVRLLVALTGKRFDDLRSELEDDNAFARPQTVSELLRRVTAVGRPVVPPVPQPVTFPDTFHRVTREGIRRRFFTYVVDRGFPDRDAERVVERYRLMGAMGGRWHGRLILPFYFRGQLVGWTGRDTTGQSPARYLTYPDGDVAKRIVFNYDSAYKGGDTLLVVEGPLDCLKTDFYGWRHGLRSVAVLGVNYGEAQIKLLLRLARRFRRAVVVFDPGATHNARELVSRLTLGRFVSRPVPDGFEDPGDMTGPAVVRFARSLQTGHGSSR